MQQEKASSAAAPMEEDTPPVKPDTVAPNGIDSTELKAPDTAPMLVEEKAQPTRSVQPTAPASTAAATQQPMRIGGCNTQVGDFMHQPTESMFQSKRPERAPQPRQRAPQTLGDMLGVTLEPSPTAPGEPIVHFLFVLPMVLA